MPVPAQAQNVSDYVKISPAADWVVDVTSPPLDEDLSEGRDIVYSLVDRQHRYDLNRDRLYNRFVIDLLSSPGVEERGTVSIDFDPAFETLTLHHIRIIRDDQSFDAIDLSEAMIFRAETDRQYMIFNGQLTFSMSVLDLRIGRQAGLCLYD